MWGKTFKAAPCEALPRTKSARNPKPVFQRLGSQVEGRRVVRLYRAVHRVEGSGFQAVEGIIFYAGLLTEAPT